MVAFFGSLSVVPWILFAQASWGMDAVPVITAAQPPEAEAALAVRDHGEVFSTVAERQAREALARVHGRHRTPVLVETVRSLDGAWVADVAHRRAKSAGDDRLYVLVAGDEREVGVVGARQGPASRLTDQQREAIRRSFLGPLQAGRPDDAISQGIRAIETVLDDAAARPNTGVRSTLIPGALLAASLAAIVAVRARARSRRRSEQRRRVSAGAVAESPQAVPIPATSTDGEYRDGRHRQPAATG